jgi:hypothetical protein
MRPSNLKGHFPPNTGRLSGATGCCYPQYAARPGCQLAAEYPNLDPGIEQCPVSVACGHGLARGARHDGRNALDHRHLWHGCLLRQQASARDRHSHRSGRAAERSIAAALGRAFKLLAVGSAAGLVLGFLATRVLAYIVYQATPRDPLVLAGVVFAMSLMGLLATWIPAQRALSLWVLCSLRSAARETSE